ncbi:FecR family protein [Pedobacter sp.]
MEESSQSRILYLISGYNAGRLNYAEQSELNAWASSSPKNRDAFIQLTDGQAIAEQIAGWRIDDTERSLSSVRYLINVRRRKRNNIILWAAIFLSALLSYGIYWLLLTADLHRAGKTDDVFDIARNVRPGTDRATLTLAGGKVVDLGGTETGTVAVEQGVKISKSASGQLVYQKAIHGSNDSDEQGRQVSSYNTISTPKGGQFQVHLPDGSKVWLNAASTLRYQANMSLSQPRVVELSGEAYFEVAKIFSAQQSGAGKQRLPFIVRSASQQIQVLGTHFNVSSYADERNVVTTLLEGSIKVSALRGDRPSALLRPGQQTLIGKNGLEVIPADTELAVAWKNGEIRFRNAPLHEILKQAARWYNIEIIYRGALPSERLSGGIRRSDKLDVLLRILALQGLKFEIEQTPTGQRLIVLDR